MAFYITKPSLISDSIILYYKGDNRWSDLPNDKVTYETESEARSIIESPGRYSIDNGGFTRSTIVSE